MEKQEAEREAMNLRDGWIIMEHPNLEKSYSAVPVNSFEETWKDLGWQKSDLLDADGEPYSWSEPVQASSDSSSDEEQ